MRKTILMLSLAAGLATPAFAITKERAPAPGRERTQIADPDEEHDRLAERTERSSRRHSYDRTSARSVLEIGSRPRG